jgi:DNA polymerase-1
MVQVANQKQNFVIIDANAFVHSSFHGYTEKLDAKGEDQRVLYGLINTLVDLTYQLPKIDFLYIVFDPSDGSLYRKSLFPSYKANRPPTNPDLSRQRNVAIKVIEDHLGIACVSYPGYEADDIIGSLSKFASKNHRVIIVSPDKDLGQLVIDDVVLLRKYRTKTEKGYRAINKDNVFEEFGVDAHQIPDWLALKGDTADNLPGLYKVGPKKAENILSKYKSIEHLLAIINEIDDEEIKEKIINNKEQLILVKKLATIVCDLPIEELSYEALDKANRIRNKEDYNKKLNTIKNHYSWPPYFLELFLN